MFPSSRFGSIDSLYNFACNSSLIKIMMISAFFAASADVQTSNPCSSALFHDFDPSYNPTMTFIPDSFKFIACACPFDPYPMLATVFPSIIVR